MKCFALLSILFRSALVCGQQLGAFWNNRWQDPQQFRFFSPWNAGSGIDFSGNGNGGFGTDFGEMGGFGGSFRRRMVAPDGSPLIATSLGQVRGRTIPVAQGFGVDAFMKIPYAEPPPRFERSEPKRPWPGAYDAGEFGPPCAPMTGSDPTEDCLFLKILTPTEMQGRLPVLFWPHGGGFRGGSNSDYNVSSQAANLIRRGVILAQPNYRVGPFGFWSSGGADAKGNYAVWDLLLALEWVRREISAFGGDPMQITMVGQGAGGVMVDTLTLSPLAHGRYTRAAALSGTVLQPNIDERIEAVDNRNIQLAVAAGCMEDGDVSAWNTVVGKNGITACMKGKSTLEIQEAWTSSKTTGNMEWHPIKDDEILPEDFGILASRRPNQPFLTGSAKQETAWDIFVIPTARENGLEDSTAITQLRDSLNQSNAIGDECKRCVTSNNFDKYETAVQLCDAYFSMKSPAMPWLEQVVETGSSYLYHAPVQKNVNYYLRNGNNQVYLYSFDYAREHASPQDFWRSAGAFHNLDLALIEEFFPLGGLYTFDFDMRDDYVRDVFLNALVNFAKFGNPNTGYPLNVVPPWIPVQPGPLGYPYLSLAAPATMREGYHMKNSMFWNEIAVEPTT